MVTCVNNRRLPIWNVYNAPAGPVDAKMGLSAPTSCPDMPFFVGGDFNLRHPLWDSSVFQAYSSCSDLIDWYDKKGLGLLNPIETSTHNCGGKLVLSFCSENSTVCEICLESQTTSDYGTLVTSINSTRHNQNTGKLCYKDLDNELFLRLLGNNHHHIPLPWLEDLEFETNTIIELMSTVLIGGCPRKGCLNLSSPWWNDDCRFALDSYRRACLKG
ncbi:hypothetical protein EPUL_003509 [Erysiphe pulchra]|uniref:Endonuclease/exonuclease/phosphatase domain-containing protein n=1 Tax=Erysiphe pulchra TaxID=225359 RepID=A0A2S4PSB3_9PEZI|nr:hypothetical protein EPUL_003509 [Erysiphe pulchra]